MSVSVFEPSSLLDMTLFRRLGLLLLLASMLFRRWGALPLLAPAPSLLCETKPAERQMRSKLGEDDEESLVVPCPSSSVIVLAADDIIVTYGPVETIHGRHGSWILDFSDFRMKARFSITEESQIESTH